jgi:hypothetical protein
LPDGHRAVGARLAPHTVSKPGPGRPKLPGADGPTKALTKETAMEINELPK